MEPKQAQTQLAKLFACPPAAPPFVDPKIPVITYGAGNLGQMALDYLNYAGIKVLAALDRNAVPGAKLGDVPVFSPASYASPDVKTPVLVAIGNMAYVPIADELKARGWTQILPFYDYTAGLTHRHPLDNGWFSGALSQEDKTNIETVMEGWEDAWSRAAYLQFLAWRIAREEIAFNDTPVDPSNRFFIPEIAARLGKEEIFLDAGAYDGRVFETFRKIAGGFKQAHLFEPDVKNYLSLKRMVALLPKDEQSRVQLYQTALCDRAEMVRFSEGFGMASRIDTAGDKTLQSARLDDLELASDFIKLHLEGGEYAALQGGLETIKKHRPLLALTVYHNRDGLWKTAWFLIQELPKYCFYFRLHSWCGTGAVIYAIPAER